jgi:acyl-coenzyme A thioesterase PaaI-like protein
MAGVIQGGFLAAMLDDTLGPALVATLGAGQFGRPLT